MTTMNDFILKYVQDNPGAKVSAIIVPITIRVVNNTFSDTPSVDDLVDYFYASVDGLIAKGALIAVHYTTLEMPYRNKTLLFPKGTSIVVEGIAK